MNRKVIIKQNQFLFIIVFSYFWLATTFLFFDNVSMQNETVLQRFKRELFLSSSGYLL